MHPTQRSWPRRVVVALALWATPSLADAQSRDRGDVPTREALLARLGSLARATGVTFEPIVGTPPLALSERLEIALGMAPHAPWVESERRKLDDAARCRGTATRDTTPDPTWADVDSTVTGLPLLMLQVTPAAVGSAQCADSSRDAAGRARSARAAAALAPDVDSVGVEANGRQVAPILQLRRTVGGDDRAWHQVRAYLAPTVLEPDEAGRLPALQLVVHRAGHVPARITMPADWTLAAWQQLVALRLAAAADGGVGPAPSLPVPRDSVLRAAYREGSEPGPSHDRVRAAQRIAARRLATVLVRDDSAFVALYLASRLRQDGDDHGAAAEMRGALDGHPCLALPTAAHPADVALADRVREPARCAAVPMRRLISRALLVPGGGELLRGQRRTGVAEAATVAALLLRAAQLHFAAVRTHGDYARTTNAEGAAQMLDHANGMRGQSRTYFGVAASAWLGTAIGAWVREARHARATAADRAYGALATSRAGAAR